MYIAVRAAALRLCTVVRRLALNATFPFISKASTWSNLVISTCIKKGNGCGFRDGRNSHGRMAGSGVQEAIKVKTIRGLSSIPVGPRDCRKIEGLPTNSYQDSLTTEWNVASFEIIKWRPVASENSLLTVTTTNWQSSRSLNSPLSFRQFDGSM
jgi:hypothetical protein